MKPRTSPKKWDRIHLTYNIALTTPAGKMVINDQRLELLKAIQEHGTIREAAAALNISYRKAMYDLESIHNILDWPLINRQSGGKKGGHATLTHDGLVLVEAYSVFRNEFQEAVTDVVKKFKRTLKQN